MRTQSSKWLALAAIWSVARAGLDLVGYTEPEVSIPIAGESDLSLIGAAAAVLRRRSVPSQRRVADDGPRTQRAHRAVVRRKHKHAA